VLIDRHGHALLTDFGAGKILSSDIDIMQTSVGIPTYTGNKNVKRKLTSEAPEVLEGVPYTKSIDWWSLGVVLYHLLLGFVSFVEFNLLTKLDTF
jgi:serine/threonine protein kinase